MKSIIVDTWSKTSLSDLIHMIETVDVSDIFYFGLDEYEPPQDEIYELMKLDSLVHENNIRMHFFTSAVITDFYKKHYNSSFNQNCIFYSFPLYFMYKEYHKKTRNDWKTDNLVDKLFIAMNRSEHAHRIEFMDSLCKHNLMNDGYISWLHQHNKKSVFDCYDGGIMKLTEFNDTLDQINVPLEFNKAAINIVVETTPNVLFLTEKTFKSIQLKKPFIIIGCNGINSLLEQYGFKLYRNIFNYDFDYFSNYSDRVENILEQLKKLKNVPLEQIVDDCNEIAEYNYNHYINIIKNKKYIPDILEYMFKLSENDFIHYDCGIYSNIKEWLS